MDYSKIAPGVPPGLKDPNTATPQGLVTPGIPPGLIESVPFTIQERLEKDQETEKQLQQAINDLDDPEEERKGVENAQTFAHVLNISNRHAYGLRDDLIKELTGDESTTQQNFFQKLGDGLRSGANMFNSGVKVGYLQDKLYEDAFRMSLEVIVGKFNKERFNRMTDIEEQIGLLLPEDEKMSFQRVLYDIGSILPGIAEGLKEGTAYGIGTSIIGGAAGAPFAGIGAVPGATGGFLFGLAGGRAAHAFRQMRGQSWLSLTRIQDDEGNTIPQPIVQVMSLAAGVINAAIEFVQGEHILRTIPGYKEALRKSTGKVFNQMLKQGTFKSIMIEHLKDYGEYFVQENLEELAQETVDIMTEHIASDLSNKFAGTDIEHSTIKEDLTRITDTFLHSAPALGILGIGGHVMGVGQDIQSLKSQQAEAKSILEQRRRDVRLEGLSEDDKQIEFLRQLSEPVTIETETEAIHEAPYWSEKPKPPITDRIRIANETVEQDVETEKDKIKELEEVKTRIADGNITIGEILGEEKTEKQKVRKAYSTGKASGIIQEKLRKAELERAAGQKKKLRDYITKLADQISKSPAKSIDFFYREAIENLQGEIDPAFRRESTLEARERRRKFIERYPEGKQDLPVKLLQMLNKKSLNELTVSELEEVRDETDRLRKLGKLKKRITETQEHTEFVQTTDKLTANVLKGENLVSQDTPVVKATAEKGKIKKAVRAVRAYTLRPSRIFDKLDGGANFKGEWHRVFYDEVNEKENQKLKDVDARLEPGAKKREELGISLRNLSKTRIVVKDADGNKIPVSLDEALDIYAGMKNERKRIAIYAGNNIDAEMAKEIVNSLTVKEKTLADYIIYDYKNHYEDLRNAFIEYTDEDLGHEENYTPIQRTERGYEMLDAQLKDELLRKTHLKKGYVEKGFTIRREDIPPEFQKPIRLGLYEAWLDQVPKQEGLINYAKKVREMHRYLNDDELSAAVKQKYGEEYLTAARHYVDRVGNPGIYKTGQKWERLSQVLRKNHAICRLSYNFTTMAKQLPSVLMYLADAGPVNLLGSTVEFAADPIGSIAFVNERDPQMKHRTIEREMEELKNYDKNAYERIINKVGKTGMIGIYALDKVATTIGWKGVYEKSISKGLSESEAIKAAQNATLRTQPAAHPKDIAELWATNEGLNWFLQFSNQLNQIFNIATYDIPASFKNHDYYRGILQIAGLSATSLFIWSIAEGRLPEKPEDFKDAFSDTALNMIPLVGNSIASKAEGWISGRTPAPIKAVGALGTWLKDSGWSKKPPRDWITDRRFVNKMNETLESLAVLYGFPHTGPKRIKKAIKKQDPKELMGWGKGH